MSILCFLGAVYMLKNNITPEGNYLIIWALFSIADAMWVGRCKK